MNNVIKPVVTRTAAAAASIALAAGVAAFPAHALPPEAVTIVMVHGAWADTSSWNGEIAELTARGYDARAIANPLRDLITDAGSVASFLHTIDGPVVLVGHSYGGAVISEAAATSPNVKALVYVDAYEPDLGESASTLNGDSSAVVTLRDDQLYDTATYPDAPAGAVDLLLKKDVFLHQFASDLPVEQATRLWSTQRATSTAALKTGNTAAAWKALPSWAFISTGDHIITPASKEFMAQRAHSRITTFPGGSHLTLVSHPHEVAAVIETAATAVS